MVRKKSGTAKTEVSAADAALGALSSGDGGVVSGGVRWADGSAD